MTGCTTASTRYELCALRGLSYLVPLVQPYYMRPFYEPPRAVALIARARAGATWCAFGIAQTAHQTTRSLSNYALR